MAIIELDNETYSKLWNYLVDHEYDIATKTNDFEDLAELFEELLGRKAEIE